MLCYESGNKLTDFECFDSDLQGGESPGSLGS